MIEIAELAEIARCEGGYQDIEVNGKKVFKGWRECDKRWNAIKPFILPHISVMDLGSHYGYFTIKCSEDPSVVVWSIEPAATRREIQKLAIEMNDRKNIYLTSKKMELADFSALSRTCESFDVILCLSMIHYYKPEEVSEILYCLSKLTQMLIIELPDKNENIPSESNWVDPKKLIGLFDSVQFIGEFPAPSDQVTRKIYLCRNFKIERKGISALGFDYANKKHEVVYNNASWYVDGKLIKSGFNVHNLLKHGLDESILKEIAWKYYELIQKEPICPTDISPYNAVVTCDGIKLIDYKENQGQEVYGVKWDDYVKGTKKMTLDELYRTLKQKTEAVK